MKKILRKKIIASIACFLVVNTVSMMNCKINASQLNTISQSIDWLQQDGEWYYMKDDGSKATGWIKNGTNWYFLCESGAMASNTVVDGYYVNSTGAWTIKPEQPLYTGNQLKERIYGIDGMYEINGVMSLNKYGEQGSTQFDYFHYTVCSYDRDMNISIYESDKDANRKIGTILNWILPTQGNKLKAIIESTNTCSQTLELDERTIIINVKNDCISIDFSPIK